MSNKPTASLTAAEVHEILTDLDNLILVESKIQAKNSIFSGAYRESLANEIAYMKIRNLILSKL